MGIMLGAAAVVKLYAIGTALSVLAVLYGIADSFGGLMYSPNNLYIDELNHPTQEQLASSSHQRGYSLIKNIGS